MNSQKLTKKQNGKRFQISFLYWQMILHSIEIAVACVIRWQSKVSSVANCLRQCYCIHTNKEHDLDRKHHVTQQLDNNICELNN